MEQQITDTREIGMVRPIWQHKDWHIAEWQKKNVTVLIAQRKTKHLIQLTLESLLTHYPDIPIVVVDGNSQDESILYLRYKAVTHPNIKVVELKNETTNSHGVTMDFAIRNHINTTYVLLQDSDVITERYGHIEGMMEQLIKDELYATGTLMRVTRANHGCGAPKDESDVLRYAHPSCSLYQRETYLLLRPFTDHGAPCVYNMMDAEERGLKIGYYPVDKYVSHLSGASWCIPRTIWNHDHGVFIRPFVTFITDRHLLKEQTDHDFDVITTGELLEDHVVQHGKEAVHVKNNLYSLRFNVAGEYVCRLSDEVAEITPNLVRMIKLQAIELKAPDEMNVGGLMVYKRNYWQEKICFL